MALSTRGTRWIPGAIVRGLAWLSVVAVVCSGTSIIAAGTAQELYLAAMAREQTVRTALAEEDNGDTARLAVDVRSVVAAYREIVRLYPASGYTDDALWQAGRLSIDAFLRFGQERDKTIGVRLLQLLTTGY